MANPIAYVEMQILIDEQSKALESARKRPRKDADPVPGSIMHAFKKAKLN